MNAWIAKWNVKDAVRPGVEHDWATALAKHLPIRSFGQAEGKDGRKLGNIAVHDRVICYQSDRKHIVGLCKVLEVDSQAGDPFVVLGRLHRFMRPRLRVELIALNPELTDLPAFKPGNLSTFRSLAWDDMVLILRACGLSDHEIAKLVDDEARTVEV